MIHVTYYICSAISFDVTAEMTKMITRQMTKQKTVTDEMTASILTFLNPITNKQPLNRINQAPIFQFLRISPPWAIHTNSKYSAPNSIRLPPVEKRGAIEFEFPNHTNPKYNAPPLSRRNSKFELDPYLYRFNVPDQVQRRQLDPNGSKGKRGGEGAAFFESPRGSLLILPSE